MFVKTLMVRGDTSPIAYLLALYRLDSGRQIPRSACGLPQFAIDIGRETPLVRAIHWGLQEGYLTQERLDDTRITYSYTDTGWAVLSTLAELSACP